MDELLEIFGTDILNRALILAGVCGVVAIIQALIVRAVRHLIDRSSIPKGSILLNLIRAALWFFALLVVLEPVFGVNPTAFVTALGITGVAISFGMQNTIANIISGIALMFARVIEVGDWIEVGNYTGVVTDISWRATTISSIIGDVIVIPNSVLNTTTLRKLSTLSTRSVTIPLDIHPESDMVEVERDIRESVAAAVEEWRDPEMSIDLIEQGYGSFGFRIDVRVPIRAMEDALTVRSAIVKACSGKSWLARW